MTEVQALERRTDALEMAQNDTTQTLRWAVAKLGRIASVQDEHTLRLEKIETDVESLRHEMDSFRRAMPSIVAEALRVVLNKS